MSISRTTLLRLAIVSAAILSIVCAGSLHAIEAWPADVTHGPWLSHPEPTAVCVGFMTTAECGGGVAFREKGSDGPWREAWHAVSGQIDKLSPQHIVRLAGLKPDTEYEYRLLLFGPSPVIYFNAMNYQFTAKPEEYQARHVITREDPAFHFRTLPAPGSGATFSFALTSDLQQLSRQDKHDLLRDFTRKCNDKDTRFTVLLGDLEDNMRIFEYNYTLSVIDMMAGADCTSLPVVPARGNHEWRGTESPIWCRFFSSPVTREPYYAFTAGDAFIIVLDSGEDRKCVPFSYDFTGMNAAENDFMAAQADWLQQTIASKAFKDAKFRIVLCHGGIFSQDEEHIYQAISEITRGCFTKEHPENRIHLWLAGHTHHYCRTIPGSTELYWLEDTGTAAYAGDDYDFTVVTNDGPRNGGVDYSMLLVTVSPEAVTLQAKDRDNTLLDAFQVAPDGKVTDLNDNKLPAKRSQGNWRKP